MPRRARPRSVPASLPALLPALVTALLVGVLAGCAGGPSAPPAPPLPAGAELMSRASQAMAAVHTAAVDLQVDPKLTSLLVRSAHGTLTDTGEATGSATVGQGGGTPGAAPPSEFTFVVTRGVVYLKGATGGYKPYPLSLVAGFYDPTALLSPERGVPALLRTATAATTEAREDVNGVPAYRVRTTVDPAVLGRVVPGLVGVNTATVWVDQATSRVLRARIDAPDPAGGPPAPVTLTLSDFNTPVTITPPA